MSHFYFGTCENIFGVDIYQTESKYLFLLLLKYQLIVNVCEMKNSEKLVLLKFPEFNLVWLDVGIFKPKT